MLFFGNARARNTHVEATLNLSFPAQALTNEAGDTLQCASAEFTYVAGRAAGDNATASSSTLTTRSGEAVATKSADFDTASGVLAGASGQALAARAAQGSARERNSQLQRLRSRPVSTRFG